MPFNPRSKAKNTTRLPALLRDELGLPDIDAKRNNRNKHPIHSHDNGAQRTKHSTPQLKVIAQRQTHHQQQQHSHCTPAAARPLPLPSSSKLKLDTASSTAKRKQSTLPPPSFKGKKAKLSHPVTHSDVDDDDDIDIADDNQPAATQPKMRMNPFTGAMEPVKATPSASAKNSSSTQSAKPTALEKLLAKAEAKSSASPAAAHALAVPTKRKSRSKMSQAEKDEEDEIAWLEAHVGNGADEVKDDLDHFIQDLDRFQVGMFDDDDDHHTHGSETGSESGSGSGSDGESTSSRSSSSGEEQELKEENSAASDQSDDDDDDSSDDGGEHQSEAEGDDDGDHEDGDKASDSQHPDDKAVSAAAARPAPTAGRYIPPALRAKMAAEAAAAAPTAAASTSTTAAKASIAQQKLRRQALGLLNRLGDANIDSIVSEFESLYRSHSRAEVTSMITSLVLDTITARSNLIDTYVILHAAFVAALHKVVGVEFAAFFVQKLVEDLLRHYRQLKESGDAERQDADGGEEGGEVKGKECLNLTVLACELYNLQVVGCPLIYDLIRLFLGQQQSATASSLSGRQPPMMETYVELLLKVMRSSGSQLRHDDPTSLKAIISLTQERVASSSSSSSVGTKLSSRSKFMLERLGDLKNNKTSSTKPGDLNDTSSPAAQLLTRMKKFLGGLGKKRTIRAYDPLRISLKDLEDADKKGKWWLVGSAWAGQTDQRDAQGLTKLLPMNASASAVQSLSTGDDDDDEVTQEAKEEAKQREKLLALARKQGMNTEARRNVFVTIMSAEDYQDAAQKLLGLKMNETQRREIVRVLLHCVGSEKTYNPYYTLILSHLSSSSHSMKITLQYSLWDFFREVGEKHVAGHSMSSQSTDTSLDGEDGTHLSARRLSNMAQTYAWLLSRSILHLHVLKPVDFTALKAKGTWFVQLLFGYLVLSCQAANPALVFAPPPKRTTRGRQGYTNGASKKLDSIVRCSLVGNVDLCRGILLFLRTKMGEREQRKVVLGDEAKKVKVDRKVERLLGSLREGSEVLALLVEKVGKGTLPTVNDGEIGRGGRDKGLEGGVVPVSDDDDDDDDEGMGMEMTW